LILTQRISIAKFVAVSGAAALVYFGQAWASGNYGWQVLMYYPFVDWNMDFQHFKPLGLKDYLWIYVRGFDRLVFMSTEYFGIFAAIGWSAIFLTIRRWSYDDKYLHLVLIATVCAATRVMVLAYDFARALLPCYLMLLIAFVHACCSLYHEVDVSA